jgi:hypothetical protein
MRKKEELACHLKQQNETRFLRGQKLCRKSELNFCLQAAREALSLESFEFFKK